MAIFCPYHCWVIGWFLCVCVREERENRERWLISGGIQEEIY